MKQVFLEKSGVVVNNVTPPLLQDNHVLVRVHYSFISSGTEHATIAASSKSLIGKYLGNIVDNTKKLVNTINEHGLAGTKALIQEKQNKLQSIGYSCAGQVIAVGPPTSLFELRRASMYHVGDYVACAGAGFAYHADEISVPTNLVTRLQDKDSLKHASITTIGAIALQGIRRAQMQLGETVCIIGLGLLGQISLQLAKQAGCRVIALDIQDDRLALAKQLGADLCINPITQDAYTITEFATAHHGVDATLITAASSTGDIVQQSMRLTRRKGRVVLVGDVKIDFDRDPFYSKEIDFLISCSYGPGRYDPTYELDGIDYPLPYVRWTENRNMAHIVHLIEKKLLNVDALISQEFGVDDAAQAYDYLHSNKALGVVLRYYAGGGAPFHPLHSNLRTPLLGLKQASIGANGSESPDHPEGAQRVEGSGRTGQSHRYPTSATRVGIIGAGGFAKTKLLPIIAGLDKTIITAVVDADVANAQTLARVYNAATVHNDYRTLLDNQAIDAVVIATPHALHTDQAIDCLAAGKAVFMEKPACVTFEQLDRLKIFLAQHPDALLCVDFNRSQAPLINNIKAALEPRTTPLIISYRMNVPFLPSTNWQQTPANGGRLIGEACHIFELFCTLTGSTPRTIAVNGIRHPHNDLMITDNVVVTVTMQDGSCCSLVYTSIGNSTMPKERMEIFFDGKAIIMDDYRELKGYGLALRSTKSEVGLAKGFDKKVSAQDKGHGQMLKQFFTAIRTPGTALPITHERIIVATEMALIADTLARQGGGMKDING